MPDANLYLIGYRGTGKSTVGRLLAAQLDRPFVDSDLQVQRATGATIAELFAEQGEAAFRQVEAQVVARIARTASQIVALGGGAVLDPATRDVLAQGRVCWLRALAATLSQRLAADPATATARPQLTSATGLDEIVEVLAARTPIYEACAHWQVDTEERTPAEVCQQICDWLDHR